MNWKKVFTYFVTAVIVGSYVTGSASVFAQPNNGYRGEQEEARQKAEFYSTSCTDGSGGSDDDSSSSSSGDSGGGGVPSGDVKAYLDKYGEDIYKMSLRYNLPYVAILAQSALESGWGESKLTTEGHNFFGIKDYPAWDGDVIVMNTREEVGGASVYEDAKFVKYNSDLEGFEGYGEFIYRNDIYRAAWTKQNDPKGYITELKNAGYATDSSYIEHNSRLIDQFEAEIKSRNDSKLPPSDKVKFDESKFAPIVKERLAGQEPSGETSTAGGDASEDGEAGTCCVTEKTEISGSDNKAKAMSYLTGKGLTGAQAAGIVGNLMQESGPDLDTKATNGTHTGIAQWDNGGRFANLQKYATSKNKDPFAIETQLEFIGVELGIEGSSSDAGHAAEKGSYDALKAVSGNDENAVKESAAIFVTKFERSGEGPGHPGFENRLKYGVEVFNEYGGSSSFKPATTSGGTCGGDGSEGSGDFVYYSQNDPKWNKGGHPTASIAPSGCGPTSIAMIVATEKDKNITPVETTILLDEKGTWTSGSGMGWTSPDVAAKEYGMTSQDLGSDIGKVTAKLKEGHMVILSGTGSGAFTSGGHIVVARELSADGKIVVANPAPGLALDKEKPEYSAYSEQELTGFGYAHAWSMEK
ncbi:MAG: phage tail tip lysozyme [Candidatus Saccharimonadales bacterium]